MDEQMVRKFAAKLHIPFYSIPLHDIGPCRKEWDLNRNGRKGIKVRMVQKNQEEEGYASVAVAHNLNDNIETLLLNLIRGTGIAGLTGMKPSANHIIRPLLFATRKSIEEYRNENNISFREDKTNTDTKFIRNKIRHKVIPLLREINPSVEITLNDTAERLDGIL